ncbi:MAG: hypothetical protein R3A47_10445 [Polyangiales bacterium]
MPLDPDEGRAEPDDGTLDPGTTTPDDTTSEPEASVFEELIEVGLTRYLGSAAPVDQITVNGGTVYTFDVEDGPRCLSGDPYRVVVRDRGSDNLMIFLQRWRRMLD